jgi:hypothetical protein
MNSTPNRRVIRSSSPVDRAIAARCRADSAVAFAPETSKAHAAQSGQP